VIRIILLAPLLLVGCVQVNLANDRGRVERVHQDVARTTSSTQSTDLTADVPVSLVPR
jgi:PBP1b-binding outer membrane lipoprotein LpoB